MNSDDHRQRHIDLHRALDELMADFLRHTGRLFSVTSILELAVWSHAQTIEPDNTMHDMRLETPARFEVGIDYARYRPTGVVSFARLTDLCVGAIAYARQRNVSRLLLDITGLSGLGAPSTLDRFEFAQRCSTAPRGHIKVVFLAPPEMIDPEGFGLDVARNRGFTTAVFASESEALAWLLDPTSE